VVWKPNVTVAAVIEQNQRFLLVREQVDKSIVINQPAGHLEPEESLETAVRREVLEETGYKFEPSHVIGIYLLAQPAQQTSFLRICFSGTCDLDSSAQILDHDILSTVWLSRQELLAHDEPLRSALVLRCIDDYLAGHRHPLELLRIER
jgi:8-oxo-dGTP pyrophosphatase MutT (NUDIX family)